MAAVRDHAGVREFTTNHRACVEVVRPSSLAERIQRNVSLCVTGEDKVPAFIEERLVPNFVGTDHGARSLKVVQPVSRHTTSVSVEARKFAALPAPQNAGAAYPHLGKISRLWRREE